MLNLYTFVFLNFLVGFVSDIVLNDLSRMSSIKSNIIKSLYVYFKNKKIIESAVLAGITIVIVLIPTIIMFIYIKKTKVLIHELSLLNILGFIFGYIFDILIEKLDIFGETLHPYYNAAGSGLYGGLSLMFSINLSYIIQMYLLPIL
jgi:hypothetical protein